jgi:hypothetical protein
MTDAKPLRVLSDGTKHKYKLVMDRITKSKLDLNDTDKVIDWVKTKGAESNQKVYYSAIKNSMGDDFPKELQEEINRLAKNQKTKDDSQELSEKQDPNFVPYDELLMVQKRLAQKEDKTNEDWKDYLIASLYTLQPPVRADYGSMKVHKMRSPLKDSNELIWGQKKGPYFVFNVYKTSQKYGRVEVRVTPKLQAVIQEWFDHLGKLPTTLFDRKITPNDLLNHIQHAFRSTKKNIGTNMLRHAYITHFLSVPRTIQEKDELALKMLHSRKRQEMYALGSHLKAAREKMEEEDSVDR